MDATTATLPSPDRRNDDYLLTTERIAIVLDGATAPANRDSGCVHDVPWLVGQLGAVLLDELTSDVKVPLPAALANSIRRVGRRHAHTCDLSNPDSPSSTAVIVRESSDQVEWLVLGDSAVAVDHASGITAVEDDRTDYLPSYTYEAVSRLRNSPDGFWIVSTNPAAADYALSGSMPRDQVRRVLLATDGTTRLVHRYGRTWRQLINQADTHGPGSLLVDVRREDLAAEPGRWPRGKRADDATAVLCHVTSINGGSY